ncbi:MAG: ABC transporter permease [bacterium]|nr:ABC transporter permease [bacterium]
MGDLLYETWRSVRAHVFRFVLTSAGIAWGAFMLTFLSAQMADTDVQIRRELEELGEKTVYMGAGVVLKNRVGERSSRSVELEQDDLRRVASVAAVERATPNIEIWGQIVRAAGRTKVLNVVGVNEKAASVRNIQAERGRFVSALDVERSARVAFLGPEAASRLFGHAAPIGRVVQIGSVGFRIIGIARAKGEQLINTGDRDNLMVFVPYTAAQRWLTRGEAINEMIFSPVVREHGEATIESVRQVLAPHHGFDPSSDTALWFGNMWETLKVLFAMMMAMRVFLYGAGLVTLMVGAVGVMNIMFVVVGERTHEIGLRKAVGARSKDVFRQFLAEAVVVSTVASIVGGTAGIGMVQVVMAVQRAQGKFAGDVVIDPLTIGVLLFALAGVAVIAGVLPARSAARVPPSEALRA